MKNISFVLLFLFVGLFSYAQPDTGFVYVKGGKFYMGTRHGQEDERPRHKVKISDFWISKYEVTNAQFAEFLNVKGNRFQSHAIWVELNAKWRNHRCRIYQKDGKFFVEKGYENYPVNYLSWYAAEAYCEWKGGRLPTEAEWEYLARLAFDKDSIPYSELDSVAWFKENSGYVPHKVGEKKPTYPGVYDLFGNQAEWLYDWYKPDYYKKSPRKNPMGPPDGNMKVIRGGSWATLAKSISPSNRRASGPTNHNITIGFRVVIPAGKK